MKEVTWMIATNVEVECPWCGEREGGFWGNPAGGVFTCDHCGEEYKVHPEADIEMY